MANGGFDGGGGAADVESATRGLGCTAAIQNRVGPAGMWDRTIESKIDNPSAGPALHLCSIPVCQSRRGVIGGRRVCTNCRRPTTRIYRAAAAAGSPSHRTRVRIKTHLDGTIVNAISIAVTTPLQYSTDIVEQIAFRPSPILVIFRARYGDNYCTFNLLRAWNILYILSYNCIL